MALRRTYKVTKKKREVEDISGHRKNLQVGAVRGSGGAAMRAGVAGARGCGGLRWGA